MATNNIQRKNKKGDNQKGTTLIEFAFAFPLYIFTLFIAFELLRLSFLIGLSQWAAYYVGLRPALVAPASGAVDPTDVATIKSKIISSLSPFVKLKDSDISVCSGLSACSTDSIGTPGDFLGVRITFPFLSVFAGAKDSEFEKVGLFGLEVNAVTIGRRENL